MLLCCCNPRERPTPNRQRPIWATTAVFAAETDLEIVTLLIRINHKTNWCVCEQAALSGARKKMQQQNVKTLVVQFSDDDVIIMLYLRKTPQKIFKDFTISQPLRGQSIKQSVPP